MSVPDYTTHECTTGPLVEIVGKDSSGNDLELRVSHPVFFPESYTLADGSTYYNRLETVSGRMTTGTYAFSSARGFQRHEGIVSFRINGKNDPVWVTWNNLRPETATVRIRMEDRRNGQNERLVEGYIKPNNSGTLSPDSVVTFEWADGPRKFGDRLIAERWDSSEVIGNDTSDLRLDLLRIPDGVIRQIVHGSSVRVQAMNFARVDPAGYTTNMPSGPVGTYMLLCPSWTKFTSVDTTEGVVYHVPQDAAGAAGDVKRQIVISSDGAWQQTGNRQLPAGYIEWDTPSSALYVPAKRRDNVAWVIVGDGRASVDAQLDWLLFDALTDPNDGYLGLGTSAYDATSHGTFATYAQQSEYACNLISPGIGRTRDARKCPITRDTIEERMWWLGRDLYWTHDGGTTSALQFRYGTRTWTDDEATVVDRNMVKRGSVRSVLGSSMGEYANRLEITKAPRWSTTDHTNDYPAEPATKTEIFTTASETSTVGLDTVTMQAPMRHIWMTDANLSTVGAYRMADLGRANRYVRFSPPNHLGMAPEFRIQQIVQLASRDYAAPLTDSAQIRTWSWSVGRSGAYNCESLARQTQGNES